MNDSPTAAAAASVIGTVVAGYDARLIREARELAGLYRYTDKRQWLIDHDRPEAEHAADETVNAMIMGNMQHVLSSLANGYERELAAVKALTSRA